MSEVFLEAQDLQAWYGSSHALQGVSLRIERGQGLALLGRNGMGKTTLIRTLLGHVRQRKGRIVIDGRDFSNAQPHEVARAGVAYVPEGRGIFPNLSVRENLLMAANAAGADGWTLESVLQTFPRLNERLSQLGAQLSGGEQQMLAIGRALMTNPKLLILDEATEGLAPLVRAEIWRCLETLKSQGLALIVIDKNIGPLLRLADRHVIVEKGRVVWTGNSAALRAAPEVLHQYVGV